MSENPYAPPVAKSDVPSAPPSHGWRFGDGELIVKKEAMLPMVDPYNGRTSERMFLYPLVIHSHSFLLRIVGTSFAVVFFLAMLLSKFPEFLVWLILGHLIALVVLSLLSSDLKILIFLTSETQEKLRKERLFSLLTTPLIAVCGVLTGLRGDFVSDATRNISAIAFAALVFARITRSFMVKMPTCHRVSSDEYRLRKFHPEAIAYLKRYSSSQIRSTR